MSVASCAARRLPSASAERLGVGDGDRGTEARSCKPLCPESQNPIIYKPETGNAIGGSLRRRQLRSHPFVGTGDSWFCFRLSSLTGVLVFAPIVDVLPVPAQEPGLSVSRQADLRSYTDILPLAARASTASIGRSCPSSASC